MTRFQLAEETRHTLEIKKSQFITWLKAIDSREEAMAYLAEAKAQYPDARHHCWAYVMGDNPNSMTAAMSDDGEPSGTAGKPMLNVLQHKPVNNAMAIVIRYFGGIKLGAGGLVRAYSQAVEQCYTLAPLQEIVPMSVRFVSVDFAQEQWFRHQLDSLHGKIINCEYQQDVALEFQIPDAHLDELAATLAPKNIALRKP